VPGARLRRMSFKRAVDVDEEARAMAAHLADERVRKKKEEDVAEKERLRQLQNARANIVEVSSLKSVAVTKMKAAGLAAYFAVRADDAEGGSAKRAIAAARHEAAQKMIATEQQDARERLHLYLRLCGSGLEDMCPRDDEDEQTSARGLEASVQRHSRLSHFDPGTESPRLIDVLSVHRRRSHAPARRDCQVVLPPVSARSRRASRESRVSRESLSDGEADGATGYTPRRIRVAAAGGPRDQPRDGDATPRYVQQRSWARHRVARPRSGRVHEFVQEVIA